jgi:hypothetical protein
MNAARYWMLTSAIYRWIMVTPAVIGTDERVKRLHRHHLSLATQRPSAPLCGQYHPGEYHPWPMKTLAIDAEDACIDCIRALRTQTPSALTQITRLLLLHGTVTEYPPPPQISDHALEELQAVASLILQQQHDLLQHTHATQHLTDQFVTMLQHLGIAPPNTLLPAAASLPALSAPSAAPLVTITPGLEALLSYEQFQQWIAQQTPYGYIIGPHTKESRLMVHSVLCPHVTKQEKKSYSFRLATTNASMLPQVFGREPNYCSDCLSGQAPR